MAINRFKDYWLAQCDKCSATEEDERLHREAHEVTAELVSAWGWFKGDYILLCPKCRPNDEQN